MNRVCSVNAYKLHLKYIDDLTLAESIFMKDMLDELPIEMRPQPETFHERTGHALIPENSKVFNMVKKTEEYAHENKMKINYKKTKLMVFNPGYSRDFFPRFNFNNNELEVVEETKLLGLVLRNDLSWASNTNYMVKRSNKKLWTLKRLRKLGANTKDLVDVYCKQIRSILEFSVQVWHPSLTEEDKAKIERVQKSAFHIILGQNYKSYNSALSTLKMKSLFSRREQLCKNFAQKSLKHPKFTTWFQRNKKIFPTRAPSTKFCEVSSRTKRFERSPISFLTNILNSM